MKQNSASVVRSISRHFASCFGGFLPLSVLGGGGMQFCGANEGATLVLLLTVAAVCPRGVQAPASAAGAWLRGLGGMRFPWKEERMITDSLCVALGVGGWSPPRLQ